MSALRRVPREPIEADPVEVYRGLSIAEVHHLLDLATQGMTLGAYDTRVLEWLKTCDQATVVTIASLLLRARGGPVEGE